MTTTNPYEMPQAPIVVLLDRELKALLRLTRWVERLSCDYLFQVARSTDGTPTTTRRCTVGLKDYPPLRVGDDWDDLVIILERPDRRRVVKHSECIVATLVDGCLRRWVITGMSVGASASGSCIGELSL